MADRTNVGELRPTQLLHTFGVGAVIDLPNISAMVMGLDEWDTTHARPIVEDRLLAAVKRDLGDQVERMLSPPIAPDDGGAMPWQEQPLIGVPVAPFPRFMRCPSCQRLAPRAKGVFDLRADTRRPDNTRYVHTNCQKANAPPVLPARFLVACSNGHLDEFPWVSFVHQGATGCQGELTLRELGASGEAADIELRCRACDAHRRMVDAFGQGSMGSYSCRGRRPHLRDFQEQSCPSELKTILLGASNGWFAVTRSALYVPPKAQAKIARLVEARWSELQDADALAVVTFLRKRGELGALTEFSDAIIWQAIQTRRSASPASEEDLKIPEWGVFSDPTDAPMTEDFRLVEVAAPKSFAWCFERVVLVERLREVAALTGFTRISDPRDFDDGGAGSSGAHAPLSRKPPRFVPASEVRGEGIFIQFREDVVAKWCAERSDANAAFAAAHRRWRIVRNIPDPEKGFEGIRLALLHSFSHALMRQIAIECGYAGASIRERLYASDAIDGADPMAGVLIYTAAPDSEGTLGGLVSLGRPEHLERHISQALEEMRLCSSDPLCAEHAPGGTAHVTLHGAACHACLFAAETSCERGNRYLDRNLLVETVSGGRDAFFARARAVM